MAGLNSYVKSTLSGFQFSIAAEDFGIAKDTTYEVGVTSSDEVFEPADGGMVAKGYHVGGNATGTISITVTAGADYSDVVVGEELALTMAAAIGGHAFAASTVVATGITENGSLGKYKTASVPFERLPFATT